VLEAVVRSLRAVRRLGQPGYSEWYQKPQSGFAGLSPFEWFETQQQHELARLLRLKVQVEEEDILGEITLTEEPGAPARPCSSEKRAQTTPGSNSRRAAKRGTPDLVLRASCSPGPDWDDEFALTPYLARWSPWNYELGAARNYRLASEIYNSTASEFVGWVRLYRTALLASVQVDGAMEAAVRCAMKIVELGLVGYLEWFESAQNEFGHRSPRQWFNDHGLTRLGSMLTGSQ
jgi:hypothetical protein